MHITAIRLGLWCLHYAASVAAPLVVGWAGKSEQWGVPNAECGALFYRGWLQSISDPSLAFGAFGT